MARWRWIIGVAVALLLAPAAWVMLSDLYVTTTSTAGEKNAEAKRILLRDVLRARDRQREVADLPERPALRGSGGTIMPVSPAFDLSTGLPSCPEWRFKAQRLEPGQAGPVRWSAAFSRPNRGLWVDEARFRLLGGRVSSFQLAALHACFVATPLGGVCDRWLTHRETVSRDDFTVELVALGVVRGQGDQACWLTPEIGAPE